MTFEIRTIDGHIYAVSTEVGDGLTRVVITEPETQPVSMEESE